MNKVYVFDIDGTLTDSRKKIDPEFEIFFYNWMQGKRVIFITGSDAAKTIEQIGERIWSSSYASMQSCGNHIYQNGQEIYKIDWEPSSRLIDYLNKLLSESKYPIRTSNHIEPRIGLLNFSVVGRNCTQEERDQYYKWDSESGERLKFAQMIMDNFEGIEASVGGQISIDIHPLGANKSQAKGWILDQFGEVEINFFGDKMERGGNDYDLARLLVEDPHFIYPVNGWNSTYQILKNI